MIVHSTTNNPQTKTHTHTQTLEVGTGFGQCLLTLINQRVEALAAEPSRRLRALLTKTLELNQVAHRVKMAPVYVVPNSSDVALNAMVNLEHDPGHLTLGLLSNEKGLRGSGQLPTVREANSAYRTRGLRGGMQRGGEGLPSHEGADRGRLV